MSRVPRRHPRLSAASAAWLAGVALTGAITAAVAAQEQSAIYVFVADEQGVPVLDLAPSDFTIREDKGHSTVQTVRRFGWPMKVTVLVDNGRGTENALVHYRSGLQKFFEGLPPDVPVSLIATAPNPRWLVRDTTDRVQISKGVSLITPEPDHLARFSDALGEYANRLDVDFGFRPQEQLPPYLPVLVSISTTQQDGSYVQREANLKMLNALRRNRVWTHMITIAPTRGATPEPGVPVVEVDEGQSAQIAKIVQEVTAGRYTPITGAATSALASKILPELAQAISARYIRQMTQHRIVFERPEGAIGPMKNFSLGMVNRPRVRVVVSTDGSMP